MFRGDQGISRRGAWAGGDAGSSGARKARPWAWRSPVLSFAFEIGPRPPPRNEKAVEVAAERRPSPTAHRQLASYNAAIAAGAEPREALEKVVDLLIEGTVTGL